MSNYWLVVDNSTIENGLLTFNSVRDSSINVSGNTISNSGHVLCFNYEDTSFVSDSGIFNNIFKNDGSPYIGSLENPGCETSEFSNLIFNPSSPYQDGIGIMGGSYIAGNYWGTIAGDGYSDSLAVDPKGYSEIPYNITVNNTSYNSIFLTLFR